MTEYQNAPGSMTFRSYIRELPHEWIFDNLLGGGAGSRGILSSAMVKEAAAKFTAKSALVKRFKSLSPAQRVRCSQVYLMGENGLAVEGHGAYAKEPLLSSLLVFAAHSGANDPVVKLFGFAEFEPVLRSLCAQTLADAGAAGDTAPHAPGCPWRSLNDVAATAALAFHGTLKRNAHGGLTRSSITALKKLTHDPTLTGKGVADDGFPGHPAGFLIGYCLSEGIILDADEEYILNEYGFAEWLKLGMEERISGMSGYASEFLGGFNLEFLREILKAGVNRKMAVNCLVPEAERDALARALYVLEFLGSLRTSHSQSAGTIRFTAVEETGGNIDDLFAKQAKISTMIMPDFSVLIPQESSPEELFEFSKIGLLSAFDKIYKGHITKASISNSLSVGTKPEYIRSWLQARRAAPNIVKTVDEWIREFERLFICGCMTLVTSDERVSKTINSLEPLREHIEKIPAHTVYRITPGSEQKVMDILEKLGFDTRAPGECGEIVYQETDLSESGSDDGEFDEAALDVSPNQNCWKPITDFTPSSHEEPVAEMRGTKYGSRLKALGISEMIQVIDYAMLTNQAIKIDYAGCKGIPQSIYTVAPTNIDKGVNATVEAAIPGLRGRKKLFLDKISRIGVVAR